MWKGQGCRPKGYDIENQIESRKLRFNMLKAAIEGDIRAIVAIFFPVIVTAFAILLIFVTNYIKRRWK